MVTLEQFAVKQAGFKVAIRHPQGLPEFFIKGQGSGQAIPQRSIAQHQQRPRTERTWKVLGDGKPGFGIAGIVVLDLQAAVRQIVRQKIPEAVRMVAVHQQADLQFEIEKFTERYGGGIRSHRSQFQKTKCRRPQRLAAMLRVGQRITPAARSVMRQRNIQIPPRDEPVLRVHRPAGLTAMPEGIGIKSARIDSDAGLGLSQDPVPFGRRQATITITSQRSHSGGTGLGFHKLPSVSLQASGSSLLKPRPAKRGSGQATMAALDWSLAAMNDPADTPIELRRRIHLNRLLGEGSMGQVYDGYAPDLGQYLAVKVLRPEYASDPEMRTRFDEEVALLGMIDHPGSPPIFGKGQDEQGLPFYAMKKVEGRTLADLLAERGGAIRMTPWRRRLLAILLEACETIAYAHEIGVVHRDIKPRNILIDRHRSVYVIDWGIAKRLAAGGNSGDSSVTTPGKVMGSPGYMAPEQADGRAASAGPQADVFALGAILYEILTGQRPFGGTGGREEMLAAVHRDPKPPHRGNWSLPRIISDICMKALHKDPAQRYPDARGLAADLRDFLEGRLSLIERIREAARQHPLRMVAIIMLTLATLTLTGRFGAQVWTDHRMAGRAMSRVAELDAELAAIAAETEAVRAQIDELKPGSIKRTDRKSPPKTREELDKELHKLNARWVLTEFEALRLFASVVELRFVWVEPEIQPMARKRLVDLIESLIERDQPALAAALIDTVLARRADGSCAFAFGEGEVERLKQLAAEADRLFVAPREK